MPTTPLEFITQVHTCFRKVCLMSLWLVGSVSVQLLLETQAIIKTQVPFHLAETCFTPSPRERTQDSLSELQETRIRSDVARL